MSGVLVPSSVSPCPGVLAVVRHPRTGAFLLIRRAKAPAQGLWGFPGGRIEPGEEFAVAAVRELREETGIVADSQGVLTVLDSISSTSDGCLQFHYVIVAVACIMKPGQSDVPFAGDDALEAEWFSPQAVRELGEHGCNGLVEVMEMAVEKNIRCSS